jgi:hypothetical protein
MFLLAVQCSSLKAMRLATCPGANKVQWESGQTLDNCVQLLSPTNYPWIGMQGPGNIQVTNSKFMNFWGTALSLEPSGWIDLTGLAFEKFTANGDATYAIEVSSASECLMSTVSFKDFTGVGLVNGSPNSAMKGYAAMMLTIFDLTSSNVHHVAHEGLIRSKFNDVYGEDWKFYDCEGLALLQLTDNQKPIPVLRGLSVEKVTIRNNGGLIVGLPNSYFVIEKAVIKNMECQFTTYGAMYYEETNFSATGPNSLTGLSSNGDLSVIGCTFEGLNIGLYDGSSNTPLMVCNSRFGNCGTCLNLHHEMSEIIGCLFESYTTIGVTSENGGAGMFIIKDCTFLQEGKPAIQNKKHLTIRNCCFNASAGVIRGIGDSVLNLTDSFFRVATLSAIFTLDTTTKSCSPSGNRFGASCPSNGPFDTFSNSECASGNGLGRRPSIARRTHVLKTPGPKASDSRTTQPAIASPTPVETNTHPRSSNAASETPVETNTHPRSSNAASETPVGVATPAPTPSPRGGHANAGGASADFSRQSIIVTVICSAFLVFVVLIVLWKCTKKRGERGEVEADDPSVSA